MTHMRRARDYTLLTHVVEQLLFRISGTGWMADIAYRFGWQQPVVAKEFQFDLKAGQPQKPPLRVVFASDFHAGPATHPQTLAAACRAIESAQPDLLLLGGDFVSLRAEYIDGLADQLGHINAPYGRFAVVGNHDVWADDVPIVRQLNTAGIKVLINQSIRLPAPFDHVWVCGLDDADSGQPDVATTLQDADGVRIMLMHSPEGLRDIQKHRFELALCGHTHGGQIALPGGRPIFLPSGRFNRTYPHGHFRLDKPGERMLIVSRGVGYGGLPVRLFAEPDIIVCTLTWH